MWWGRSGSLGPTPTVPDPPTVDLGRRSERGARRPPRPGVTSSARDDLDRLADCVEHLAQAIVVGVPQAQPRVGHESRLDRLRRRPRRREVAVDEPLAVVALDRLESLVARDAA